MPLEEYRRKRDFGKTPEPSETAAPAHGGLSYVVQKHAASHLHWDFRIELDGVLLSWAVPKGPSLDPADKRLAMHVEDHPIAYGQFEGVIPKGEYGGGTVMVWDRGTWEPDHGDPVQHLAEGHLKFHLHGERLRGRWMLVRTKGYGGRSSKESWLLFKEHDEFERGHGDFDAVAEWTTSVATGRTMDEIAENVDATWHSNASVAENISALGIEVPEARPGDTAQPIAARDVPHAKKAAMPRSIDVELATLVKSAPEGERWLHEIKFDGYRILAFIKDGTARLISRNGNDWTTRFAEVADAVSALSAKDAVLDGEVVVVRPDGTTDFQALQNHAKRGKDAPLTYFAFDLLHLDGYDLRPSPLAERKKALAGLLGGVDGEGAGHRDGVVRYTDHIEGHGDVFYSHACDLSLEGIVSKRLDAPYRSGRQRDWQKTKCLLRQEFVVVGYTDPGGSRAHFGALVLAVHDGDTLRHSGRVGTGFSDASLAEIRERLRGLDRDEPPVANAPTGAEGRGIHWVEPRLVAEVAFTEWTENDTLRHPSFLGLRDDKDPASVTAEKPADPRPATVPEPGPERDAGSSARSSSDKPIIAGVLLSNPDRVLWPDVGVTKLDLARHYELVAERMLPHVTGRPLSLVRCPTGYTGECFYQKHIEHFPKAVGTVLVYEPEADKKLPYGTVHDLGGLVGLAQMGVLEIHPWGARNDDVEKPDRLVFDLDPDEGLPFTTVSATAQLLRSELARLDLESWLKTTGGKGLHVVVPVTRTVSWDSAKDFARAFVDHIVSMEPRLFTGNMSKAQRGGRIFIDYLRNARGATAIAPYATRARAGAPVAVPLRWDELDGLSERREYTVANIAARLADTPVDPWADLVHPPRQSITKRAMSRLGTG